MTKEQRYIIDGIKDGIVENGNKRPFDMIDYYLLTNVNYADFFQSIKEELSVSEIRLFKQFCTLYKVTNVCELEDFDYALKIKNTYGAKLDQNGKLIPNSGSTYDYDENVKLAKYLVNHNIPLCQNSLFTMQKRCALGIFDINELDENISKGIK